MIRFSPRRDALIGPVTPFGQRSKRSKLTPTSNIEQHSVHNTLPPPQICPPGLHRKPQLHPVPMSHSRLTITLHTHIRLPRHQSNHLLRVPIIRRCSMIQPSALQCGSPFVMPLQQGIKLRAMVVEGCANAHSAMLMTFPLHLIPPSSSIAQFRVLLPISIGSPKHRCILPKQPPSTPCQLSSVH